MQQQNKGDVTDLIFFVTVTSPRDINYLIYKNEHLHLNIVFEISRMRLISYKILRRKCSFLYIR